MRLVLRSLSSTILILTSILQLSAQAPKILVATSNDTLALSSESIVKIDKQSDVVSIKVDFDQTKSWRYKLDGYLNIWSKWDIGHNIAFQLQKGDYILFIEEENGKIFSIPFVIERNHSFLKYFLLVAVPILLLLAIVLSYKRIKVKLIKQIKKEVRLELEKEFQIKQLNDFTLQKKSGEKGLKLPSHQTYSQKYEQVSVLFADIQGFTKIVELINPESLIDELDKFFIYFDEVAEKYGIEKIKTIGDAYMCAGGIPEKNRTNPVEIVLAAQEMQYFMKKSIANQSQEDKFGVWELRIGIHTGPVISGMVGRKKIAFDIWGDTVNIASRMESSGKAGEVNITGVTYQYIRDFFNCQYRGKMPIKYKGETDMYFVKGIKPELSIDGQGILPNENFFIRLQEIRFGDLEEYIVGKLKADLPGTITYHNADHTIDVITRVEILGRGENVSEKDLLLLKTAALLHDAGFLFNYQNHEENSILIAKEVLPKYKYSQYQIDWIIKLIEATKIDASPENLLEEIIKDADLDYLGRADFIILSESLYNELNYNGQKLSIDEWNQQQYNFISNHRYYTNTARNLRQVNKERQLSKLKALSLV